MSTIVNFPDDEFERSGVSWKKVSCNGAIIAVWESSVLGIDFAYMSGGTKCWLSDDAVFSTWEEALEFAIRRSPVATCANCKNFWADVEYGALAGTCEKFNDRSVLAVHNEFCSSWSLRK